MYSHNGLFSRICRLQKSKLLSTLQHLLGKKSDGVIDAELTSWPASERSTKGKDNEIPLRIVLSNNPRKYEKVANPNELLNRIYSLSREVKEIQRPLGLENFNT